VGDVMRHVDLCSGIGGFALGFEWAELSRPVLFCDIEPWSRQVLAKHWPNVPIAQDVKELANDPDRNVPDCDILTAGYPCQPFSLAGKRLGSADTDRHIWPYILRIVASKRPSWCVFENVYGHLTLGLDQVLLDLEAEGYATRPFIVPACGVDAPHKRDRIWIIAKNMGNTSRSRQQGDNGRWSGQELENGCEDVADPLGSRSKARGGDKLGADDKSRSNQRQSQSGGDKVIMADTNNSRREEQRWPQPAQPKHQAPQCRSGWLTEPPVGRVAHGIPKRVDRLKGLGNAIVPQIAQRIGETIKRAYLQ
jgi:DNA (cytosine-5)-methyltransferase 1